MKEVREMISKERLKWPNQIRDEKDIKIGSIISKVYSHLKDYIETFKVIGIGISTSMQDKYIVAKLKDGFEEKHFFVDSNIVPYPSGWNGTNYLRPATEEEIENYLSENVID